MDVEGEEAKIISSTSKEDWNYVDMILEVGTETNKRIVFDHLNNIGVNMFSQKKAWNKVETIEDIPSSYKEGSLFVSTDEKMIWS